jgi:hypothetical protein
MGERISGEDTPEVVAGAGRHDCAGIGAGRTGYPGTAGCLRPCPLVEDRDKIVGMLQTIYQVATEKFTVTAKFAHIAELAAEALEELGERDPRYAHLPEDLMPESMRTKLCSRSSQ